ncbi:hypothetical protein Ptr902_08950 [Pyrenophora tritici-repentis]|nr:hypothetical protein Ptr902_08950 [Pyrenophora tritici-repentis]
MGVESSDKGAFEECKLVYEAKANCLQFSYAAGKCSTSADFKLGESAKTTPSPLTKARIVGLAVGLAIADILLVGLCLYYFLHRCRNNLSLLRLKKRFARDKNSNEDVAELRGPPVYAQEREDEGVQYEVYVEPSEVQGT